MKKLFVAAALSAAIALPTAASAATIVDTGSNPSGTSWSFSTSQWFAGLITLTGETTVTSIEAFLDLSTGGDFIVNVLGSAGYLPNATNYFSQTVTAGPTQPQGGEWLGVTGLGLTLAAGDYWVEFQPVTARGTWRGAAPSPLAEYAQNQGAGWQDFGQDRFDYLDVGIRVEGDLTPVPLPAGLPLMLGGLGGLLVLRRRKTA